MIRKFITLDGDVLDETDWNLRPVDSCFYCDQPLQGIIKVDCPGSQDSRHDWISLVNPSEYRR